MNHKTLCFIIPCHNENACIAGVLRELSQRFPEATFAVVDDASTDSTAEITQKLTSAIPGIVLLKLPINLGIGGAVQTGFRYAAAHDFQYAVKFDGDGQHPVDQIAALLAPLERNEADLVIGSRFLENKGFQSTRSRRIGITIFRHLNSLLIGKTITDNTSGFRAYNRAALHFAAEYYPSFDYPEPEEVILFAKNGFRILEVPVEMRARQGGVSSINPHRAVYYMCKVIFSVLMAALRPPESRKDFPQC